MSLRETIAPDSSEHKLLEVLHLSADTCNEEDLQQAQELINRVKAMDGAERDTIRAAFVKGPLESGDVPSKSARGQLVSDGFMALIIVKGEEGYCACTYKGGQAYRLIEAGAGENAS